MVTSFFIIYEFTSVVDLVYYIQYSFHNLGPVIMTELQVKEGEVTKTIYGLVSPDSMIDNGEEAIPLRRTSRRRLFCRLYLHSSPVSRLSCTELQRALDLLNSKLYVCG